MFAIFCLLSARSIVPPSLLDCASESRTFIDFFLGFLASGLSGRIRQWVTPIIDWRVEEKKCWNISSQLFSCFGPLRLLQSSPLYCSHLISSPYLFSRSGGNIFLLLFEELEYLHVSCHLRAVLFPFTQL